MPLKWLLISDNYNELVLLMDNIFLDTILCPKNLSPITDMFYHLNLLFLHFEDFLANPVIYLMGGVL